MAIKSIIVDVLNKLLSDYVENVDAKQIFSNISLLGGDIALDDLVLKQSVLDELNLPVKTAFGRLGKLNLKIPSLTNLYTAPWIVCIERLFLLSVPNEEVNYDDEKEERLVQEAKQKEIAKVEETKRIKELLGTNKQENAGFVEDFVAHIVKNVQVTIKDIHIRYEDRVTNPGSPFSLGITLSSLKLVSTDEKGKPADAKQSLSIFHKVLDMEGLAFYWNPNSPLYASYEEVAKLQKFQSEIATKTKTPDGYNYMFGPISATAQLQLNQKPEQDGSGFTIPKIHLDMNMNVLSIGVSKMQYRDLVKFLESMDRMARAAPYRKYRPLINKYKGHSKTWSWKFAFKCVVKTEVRRKQKNGNWNHIRKHRDRCKRYEQAYTRKLLEGKKPSANVLKEVAELEKALDVFNIILLRQRAELKVQKTKKVEEAIKKETSYLGRFVGWLSGDESYPNRSGSDIANKIDAAMTKEEKQKLYEAIGYQENAAPVQYPQFFVAIKTSFNLGSLQIVVYDEDIVEKDIAKFVISGVQCTYEERPSAKAIKVEIQMQQLKITGTPENRVAPLMAYPINTGTLDKPSLLSVMFETNPLDGKCHRRLKVFALPLEMMYDAKTVICLVDVFKPPEKPSLNQLQSMAVSKLEDIQDRSATLIQQAIRKQKVLDLELKFEASRLILPQLGKLNLSIPAPVLVVSLGSLSVTSSACIKDGTNISNMLRAGSTVEEVRQEIISQSHYTFLISLKNVQILVAKPDENWEETLKNTANSKLHLVLPTSVDFSVHRSLLINDPRVPQFKVTGQLPSLFMTLSEERLFLTAGILTSVPLPEAEPEMSDGGSSSESLALSTQMVYVDERKNPDYEGLELVVSSVKLEFLFEMKELRVIITKNENNGGQSMLIDFSLMAVEMEMVQRPFDMTLVLRLGGVSMDQNVNGVARKVITTPMSDGKADYLFTTKFLKVNKNSPEFYTVHKNVENLLDVNFTSLDVALHQTGIRQIMAFTQNLQDKVSSLKPAAKQPTDRIATTQDPLDRILAILAEEESMLQKPSATENEFGSKIIFKLAAKWENLSVSLANPERDLTTVTLQGFQLDVLMMKDQIEIESALKTLHITDCNPATIFPMILESEGAQALTAKVIMFENPDVGMPQMSVKAQMACFRIFFLNTYVSSLLGFLNNFQAALNAIKAASAAAAAAAKQNMQQAYENAKRVALDIEIKAPLVYVPRNVKCRDAFMIDLGTIIMNNKFSEISIPNDTKTLSIDTITLILKELHISRVVLDGQNTPLMKSKIIAPFDLNVLAKRNLSNGWYKLKPPVELESQLEAIKLNVLQEDMKLAMFVFFENLIEDGSSSVETVGSTVAQVAIEYLQKEDNIKSKLTHHPTAITPAKSKLTNENGYKTLTVNFLMKSIEVNLLVPSATQAVAEEKSGLAHFDMSGLKLQGVMYENGAMIVGMQLEDCSLKDLRRLKVESSTRITNLLSVKGSRAKSLLHLNYNHTPNNQTLTCNISGFTLVVSPDYLLEISDFFLSALSEQQPENSPEKPKEKSRALDDSNILDLVSPSSAIFQFEVVLEKPDIILVESMSDINSKALIFSVECDGQVWITAEKQAMGLNIKNLQLYSCVFNPERRKETLIQVLMPCTLSVAGSCQTGKQPKLHVILSDVKISVTPGVIKIFTNTVAVISAGFGGNKDEKEVVQPDWSMLWRPKSFKDSDHSFLLTEEGTDPMLTLIPYEKTQPPSEGIIMVEAGSMIVTLEAGFGVKTLPLILLESSFRSEITDWTQQLQIQGTMSLQMSYFNSKLALWEPLIEPTLDKNGYSPWGLNFELKNNAVASPMLSPLSDVVDAAPPPPATSISVCSEQNLEITVSKSCLEVLTNLSKAFKMAVKEGRKVKELEGSPYQIVNQTGITVVLQLKDTDFAFDDNHGGSSGLDEVVLESGAQCGLILRDVGTATNARRKSILNDEVQEKILIIVVPNKNCTIKLPMARAEKRYFTLNSKLEKQGLVSEVTIEGSCHLVTLRSIIQVNNQFSMPVDVFYMIDGGVEMKWVGLVQPGQKLDLPLHAVYTVTNELYFHLPGHSLCPTPFFWKKLQNSAVSHTQMLQCHAMNKNVKELQYLNAVGEIEQVYFEGTAMHTCIFNIVLGPTVVLKNLLPVTLVYVSEMGGKEHIVQSGGTIHLPDIVPGESRMSIRLDACLEKSWFCLKSVLKVPPELDVWSFGSHDSPSKMSLNMGMHTVNVNGTLYMSLYSPFWMINKTGLQLYYRQPEDSSNVTYTHPSNFVDPIMYAFRPNTSISRKKVVIKAMDSDWSNNFSLDVVGSSGSVSCKSNNILYQIGVSIRLSSSNLTKLVTFTPYYMIVNHTSLTIQCQEGDRPADSWTDIEPANCSPLWPKGLGHHDNTLRLKVKDTNEMTAPFSFTENHTVLLKLNNKFGGINVHVQVLEGNVFINLSGYKTGVAPALIVNHTNQAVTFWEKAYEPTAKKLGPFEQVFFAWEDPRGQKMLGWYGMNASREKEAVTNQLRKDGIGKLWVSKVSMNDPDVYWVSFLDGMQRVLLFTTNHCIAREAQTAADLEPISMELTMSLKGIGLSLVSDIDKRVVELLYMQIASSGIIWESKRQNRRSYERFSESDSSALELAYQRFKYNQGNSMLQLSSGVVVDLSLKQIITPLNKELRRTSNPGLWFQLKNSAHHRMLHAKLNHLQVDCQMPNCMFPNILAPVPPPKSVAADNVMRPFVEMSMLQRLHEHSSVQQFKYLRVLVQEFHIKVELQLLYALLDMFAEKENLGTVDKEAFASDIQVVTQPLLALIALQTAQEKANFYDELHLSPLKIHFSYSSSKDLSKLNSTSQLNIIHAVLENIGVVLTDVQDVIFKLSYFERESTFLTQSQLLDEIRIHYTTLAVKQVYLLVLGLDVIGNPIGLVRGLSKGVGDLFYEPYQGAIQGPLEFAEGVRNGVSSLLGHTVSGAAGAVSKITGVVGKTLANLSMDEDYQRRRREQQQSRPTDLREGLFHSGKGLLSNVVSGVTGVVTKPVAGARKDGFGGFFKGIGTGVIGLVTQPAGGVVDLASNTLAGVKRATDKAQEQRPLRTPRYVQLDGLIRPYNPSNAFGNHLLQIVDNGRFAKSDRYIFHALLGSSGKEALIYTDNQIMLIKKNDVFGHWQVDWYHPWTDLTIAPYEDGSAIKFQTGGLQKKPIGLMLKSQHQERPGTRSIFIPDAKLKTELLRKANNIMASQMPQLPQDDFMSFD